MKLFALRNSDGCIVDLVLTDTIYNAITYFEESEYWDASDHNVSEVQHKGGNNVRK
jgi:hypothetical protein